MLIHPPRLLAVLAALTLSTGCLHRASEPAAHVDTVGLSGHVDASPEETRDAPELPASPGAPSDDGPKSVADGIAAAPPPSSGAASADESLSSDGDLEPPIAPSAGTKAYRVTAPPKRKPIMGVGSSTKRRAPTKDGRMESVPYTPPRIDTTPLKASLTDDNQRFDAFTAYVADARTRLPSGSWQDLPVSQRLPVRVVDSLGAPIPNAVVTLRGQEDTAWRSTTLGNGETTVYPGFLTSGGSSSLNATISAAGQTITVALNPAGPTVVELPEPVPSADRMSLDVAFVIDTTGSMGDEIDRIKGTLTSVVARLQELDQPVDLRLGGVLYRDRGDAYVTQRLPFTTDIASFDRTLRSVVADGGGDTPESLNAGLRAAVHDLDWRSEGARVAFLVADAPPHMDYAQDVSYGTSALHALGAGIRVHTVAASGLDSVGSLVFRQIAQLTAGNFIFITYGSTSATAASHGIADRQMPSNNLDQIVYDRIRAEIEGWRS